LLDIACKMNCFDLLCLGRNFSSLDPFYLILIYAKT
jgi:hypothetical protein